MTDDFFAAFTRLTQLPDTADRIEALTAERDALAEKLARAVEALECARALCDTPIARRRLNLSPADPMLMTIRTTLAALQETKA